MDAAQQLFETWGPVESPWSRWAKPVLFAQLGSVPTPDPLTPIPVVDTGWAPPPDGTCAVVVDLPGALSVEIGAALAERGFRPIPLYNGVPGPMPTVDVWNIVSALHARAERVGAARVPADAPPAFLIDSARLAVDRRADPGDFDNRWMVFPQDFPSATLLQSRGVERVLLVGAEGQALGDDLSHVLRRWQDAGVPIRWQDVAGGMSRPIEIVRPKWFRAAWYRALVSMGLRRSSAGGFGAVVPTPGSGG